VAGRSEIPETPLQDRLSSCFCSRPIYSPFLILNLSVIFDTGYKDSGRIAIAGVIDHPFEKGLVRTVFRDIGDDCKLLVNFGLHTLALRIDLLRRIA
jgi:hypothetical protein